MPPIRRPLNLTIVRESIAGRCRRSCPSRRPGRRPSGTRAVRAPAPSTGSASSTVSLAVATGSRSRRSSSRAAAAPSGSAASRDRRGRRRGAGVRAAHGHARRRGERRARSDDDAVVLGVLVEHVQRLAVGDADPAPLPDGEAVLTASGGRGRRPSRSTICPVALVEPAVAGEEAGPVVPARKQRSCESTLLATGRPAVGGDLRAPRAWSAHRAGSASARATRRRQRGEHVRLVLGRVGGERAAAARAGRRLGDPRVVAGGELRRTRGGRRARASRRAARDRCSRRTGSGSRRPRTRR